MNRGTVCLTFDDGRADNVSLLNNSLLPNSIPLTLNITTGYVDGTCPKELLPTNKPAMTVHDVIILSKSPLVEIAAHGDKHLNTDEDIDRGRKKLQDWLGMEDVQELGFASPSTQFPLGRLDKNSDWLQSHKLSYLAMGQRLGRCKPLQLLCRKAGRVIHIPLFYEIAYKDTLMERCEDGVIYRVPIHRDTTLRQIKRLVNKCAKEKKVLFLMFHSIDSVTEDNWVWDIDKFNSLCHYLLIQRKMGTINLCTVKEAISLMENDLIEG